MGNKPKRAPVNSSETDLGVLLTDAVILGPGDAILMQEAEGQQSFVGSDTLPTEIICHEGYDAKTILESAGVKFLGEVEGDPLFQYVELPKGWKKTVTDHSMWSKLTDDKGRERASIFYKAACYDRNAHMSLCRRFKAVFDYDRFGKESVGVTNVMDGDKVVYATEPIEASGRKSYQVSDESVRAVSSG